MQVEPETIRLASPTKPNQTIRLFLFSSPFFSSLFFLPIALPLPLPPICVGVVVVCVVVAAAAAAAAAAAVRIVVEEYHSSISKSLVSAFFFGFVKRYGAAISQAKRSKPKFDRQTLKCGNGAPRKRTKNRNTTLVCNNANPSISPHHAQKIIKIKRYDFQNDLVCRARPGGAVVDGALAGGGFTARVVAFCVAGGWALLGVEDERDNETVQTENFSKDKNQNHADKELWLLPGTTDTGITHDADGVTCCETGDTDGEAGAKVNESFEEWVLGSFGETASNEHRDNEAVDGNDTSHDNRDNRLHDKLRVHDSHVGNTDAGLGGAVTSSEGREDHGCGGAHNTEETGVDWAVYAFSIFIECVVCTEVGSFANNSSHFELGLGRWRRRGEK